MNKSRVRFDPLYRIIDETDEMKKIEGKLVSLFDRIKNMNNLGIIPKVLEGAKHSKYEHHSGVLFHINSLIEYDYILDTYKKPLVISALFLHLGHFPFTYSTERAALIAANLDDNVKRFFESRIDKLFSATNIDNGDDFKQDLFSLRNYKSFYKFNSAYLLLEKWDKIKDGLKLNETQKKITLTNIFDDKNSDGYKYIQFADKADYVQRDALYFGSARIDISTKHLYRTNPLIEEGHHNDEWSLINSNLRYLQETYYRSDDVRWFSRIFEKIIAKLIINKNFEKKWLLEYNDDEFITLITKNRDKTNKLAKIPTIVKKLSNSLFSNKIKYSLLFTLNDMFFSDETSLGLECKIIDIKYKSKKLLDYPFERGILLDIEYDTSPKCTFLSRSYRGYTQYSISIFQDEKNRKSIEVLKCLKAISKNCSVSNFENIRENLGKQFSWTNNCRIDSKSVIKAIAEIMYSIEQESNDNKNSHTVKFLEDLQKIKTFSDVWRNPENYYMIRILESRIKEISIDNLHSDENLDIYEAIAEMILGLPIKLLQHKPTKRYLNKIIDKIKKDGPLKGDEVKGNYFEALWLLSRIINSKNDYSFLINNLIIVNPEKPKEERDENEFDVIEFYLDKNGKANCWIYACSISNDYVTNNTEQLKKLAQYLRTMYNDLNIQTQYVIPHNNSNWDPKTIQAGFNFFAE